jgi:hypothetical protein
MATVYGMTYEQICDNWKDDTSCRTIQALRRLTNCEITAVDISEPAMSYGSSVGSYDNNIVCNSNDRSSDAFGKVAKAMQEATVCISTAALVSLDLESIELLVGSFPSNPDEGYVLVNFLNPFALEKADDTKCILLKHLDFVASRATRHRRLSPLERESYSDEEWALSELWVRVLVVFSY